MEHHSQLGSPESLYEVELAASAPESLRTRFPQLPTQVTGGQTVLRQQIRSAAQLDDFFERLQALGLRIDELHRLPGPVDEVDVYEVRIAGEVRPHLVQHLSGLHCLTPAQPHVKVVTVAAQLHQFLRTCTECGASIHRVRRLGAAS